MSSHTVSDAVAKKRLLKLADFLENEVPDEHFDFGDFGRADSREPNSLCEGDDALDPNIRVSCGTKACALGWAPALPFAKKLGVKLQVTGKSWNFTEIGFTRNGRKISVHELGKLLFGLKPLQMYFIFYGSVLNGNGTRQEVAEGIRAFVAIRYGR